MKNDLETENHSFRLIINEPLVNDASSFPELLMPCCNKNLYYAIIYFNSDTTKTINHSPLINASYGLKIMI